VPPPLVDILGEEPLKALMRAPFPALAMVMFLTGTLATMSSVPAY
jgi:hypothetical protein